MHQEQINRSITNNQYVQTRFNQFSPLSPQGAHNYVPFLIKSNRFASQSNNISAPPIGTYNLPSCFERKKSPFEDRISHFILQSQKKNDQMCMFKSSLNRFQKAQNHSPGPASYNLFKNSPNPKNQTTIVNSNKENLIDLAKTCPSIPHKTNKYGYSIVNGELKNIEKTDQQLERQRQSRKNYVQTLEGEHQFLRDSAYYNFHNADEKRRLYQETTKFFQKKSEVGFHSKSEINLLRKPKYEHLYHSKPVPVANQHKLIGPGQYEISKNFNANRKKQKFQFFGSTEVRFKSKPRLQEKGYSLLEMIKQNQNVDETNKEKKSPYRKKSNQKSQPQEVILRTSPGPGQYDPNDICSKQSRRKVFFPVQERFKENLLNDEQNQQDDMNKFSRSRSKMSYNGTNLKKDRFKPIHQNYQPVKSQQICGILTQNIDGIASKERKSHKKNVGKLLKLNSKRGNDCDNIELKSWSRDEGRKKGGYMRYLKEQLAFISYSPVPQETSKKTTKKYERKEVQQ